MYFPAPVIVNTVPVVVKNGITSIKAKILLDKMAHVRWDVTLVYQTLASKLSLGEDTKAVKISNFENIGNVGS